MPKQNSDFPDGKFKKTPTQNPNDRFGQTDVPARPGEIPGSSQEKV